MMDHDAIAEISGAYALDAVTPDEGHAVEEHLDGCVDCRALLAEMRGIARVLPFACEPVDPSPALKRRILDVAQAERRAEQRLRRNARGGGAEAGGWRRPATALVRYWGAAAAALVLVAGGFGIGTMQARSAAANRMAEMEARSARMQEALALERAARAATAADAKNVHGVVADVAHGKIWDMSGGVGTHRWHCMFVQPPDKKNATLIASVPPAPRGMKYQAWIIHKGTIHRAPVLPSGVMMLAMPMPLEAGDVVAFSMEPPQGSARPTGPFMMKQTLS
ncbi:MAG TPA: anti-sigma factor [Candidatus Eremiobacteraceae bacterium]|nr:anti-sigma factor [Candidatus Eremiobacteraceae bacterium]